MTKAKPLRDVMLNASAVMLAVMLASRFLGYLFHFTFVRLFTKEDYGSFVFLWSLGLFLCGLIPNISAAMQRYVAYYRGGADHSRVGATIRTGIAVEAALVAVAFGLLWGAYASGLTRLDAVSFSFVAVVMALTAFGNLFSGIINGHRRPEVPAIFNFVQNLLRVVSVAAAAFLANSLAGVILFVTLGFALSTLLVAAYEAKAYGLGTRIDAALGGTLLSYGFYNIVHVTANNILSWAGVFLIQFYIGAAALAVYNVAWLASTVNLIFFSAALQIFSPVAAELFGAGKRDRAGYLTSYMFESFFLLFLPVFMAITIFAREILTLFFTAEYGRGALSLQILSFGAFLFGLSALFTELIYAEGRPAINARNIGFGAVLNFILNLFLIPLWGIEGAAASALLSSLAILAVSFLHVRKVVRLEYSPWRIAKITGASTLAVASVFAVKSIESASIPALILSSASLGAVYCALILAFKALRKEDLELAETASARAPHALRAPLLKLISFGVQPKASR
jgi:O-antigen/teichoic acid export membrane protein